MSLLIDMILWTSRISFGILTMSITTTSGLLGVVFPLSAAMFGPQIFNATSASTTVTGESLIWLDWSIHLKSFMDG